MSCLIGGDQMELLQKLNATLELAIKYRSWAEEDGDEKAHEYWSGQIDAFREVISWQLKEQ